MKVLTTVGTSSGMALRKLSTLLKTGLMIVGLLTMLFVVLAYGWNGEPPTVELS